MNSISPASQGKTPSELVASKIFDKFGLDQEAILSTIVDVALNAERSTPTGDTIPDYKTRLAAAKLMLELRGEYVNKSGKVNVNVGFFDMLRKQDGNNQQGNSDIIVS